MHNFEVMKSMKEVRQQRSNDCDANSDPEVEIPLQLQKIRDLLLVPRQPCMQLLQYTFYYFWKKVLYSTTIEASGFRANP